MRNYEETHLRRFPSEEDCEEFLRNPWRIWRFSGDCSPVAVFVQGLKDDEFLIALTARNLTQIGVGFKPTTLPTDGDLDALEGVLSTEIKTDRSDWQNILSENFAIRTTHLTGDVFAGTSEGYTTSRRSDIEDLDWQQLLHLAWCGALKQASVEEGNPSSLFEKAGIDLAAGEHEALEFKSSLRWDHRQERVNKDLEDTVVKTLAGFLNSGEGGRLLIGVNDSGAPVGIAVDYGTLKKKDRDGFELRFWDLVEHNIGLAAKLYLTVTFHEIDGKDICQITVKPSDYPIYVKKSKGTAFYLRTGNGTRLLPVDEALQYARYRW